MRYAPWLFVVVLAALSGCNADPRPAAGRSALRLKISAQPHGSGEIGRPAVYGQGSEANNSELNDIVVWVEPVAFKSAAHPAPAPVIISISAAGSAKSLAGVACVGQTVLFKNAGLQPIRAYSVSDGNQFDLGTIAPLGQASQVMRSAGPIEILCDSAEESIAMLFVAPDAPVFLTHTGAMIDINDLPPGRSLVVSWHPRSPGSVTEVELESGRVTHATIEVGVDALPRIVRK